MAIKSHIKKRKPDKSGDVLSFISGSVAAPELVEVARLFLVEMGGPPGMAKALADIVKDGPKQHPSGIVRAQIMRMMMDAWKYLTPKDSIANEVGTMTDEELAAEIKLRLRDIHPASPAPAQSPEPIKPSKRERPKRPKRVVLSVPEAAGSAGGSGAPPDRGPGTVCADEAADSLPQLPSQGEGDPGLEP